MQHANNYVKWAFVAVLLALGLSAYLGMPLVSPETMGGLAALGLLGETASVSDLADLLKKQGEAFHEFKNANDARIKAIETKGYAPADLEAKVDTINAELTKLGADIVQVAKKANRPDAGSTGQESPEMGEYKTAFGNFVRKGNTAGLGDLEAKAFTSTSDVEGGYLCPAELDREIQRIASSQSVIRQLADVRQIGAKSLEFNVKTSGVSARWVGSGEAGGESTAPTYAEIEIKAEEMEVEPWAHNDALEDAVFNVEADLADEAGIGFGEAEGSAFSGGNGIKKPRGFLTYDTVANASYAWGKVGFVLSGASGAFAGSNPGDKIIDLLHALKPTYRNGAVLVMADPVLAELRKIKDGSGNFYLFQPDATGEFGGFVLGKPVMTDDFMPALAADSFSIAYANWKSAYRIVDRAGISLIRDNITAKGKTKFNFRRRVGGGIKNFEAIKIMKFNS